jgi:BirA family biotin operon repressor/biotin-[acetyl-CoA-carboxylase] ligase
VTRFVVHRHDELTSTMDEAHALARGGAPDGTVVVARRQASARGRQGRAWVSPEGNLHVSVLLRPGVPVARLTELGFAVALAVADTVDNALGGARAQLKWPNDVLVGGAKVAGILVELAQEGAAVVGIGVNVAHSPEGVPYPATSLLACGGRAVEPEAVLAALLEALELRLALWMAEGFALVRASWLARGPAYGDTIRLRRGEEISEGCYLGLDTDGALLIRTESGAQRVVAGEVTNAPVSLRGA